MSQTVTMPGDKTLNIVASGTFQGNPAPLKDPVTYVNDDPSVGTLAPLSGDPNSVVLTPANPHLGGSCNVTGTSGSLAPVTITVTVTPVAQVADTLVLTPTVNP